MNLAIMIPTFNRCNELKYNVDMICKYIRTLKKQENIYILISDNSSTDSTKSVVEELISLNSDIKIDYNLNKINIGLGKNFLKVLELADAEYCLLLGDDDYLQFEYLKKVYEAISKDKAIYAVVPSYYNINPDGTRMDRSRDLDKKSKIYNAGFYNCFINSWRSHQMSGLVFKKNNLYDECISKNLCNYYVQIYLFTKSCLLGKTYHLTEYPVKVTRPLQNKKAWNYGKDGLIGDVFENYKNIEELKNWQRTLLEIRFLQEQYWRLAMYLKVGFSEFFNCIFKIQSSKNTTKFTSVFLPIIIFLIFIQKFISLMLKGDLIKTLKTKVDVK